MLIDKLKIVMICISTGFQTLTVCRCSQDHSFMESCLTYNLICQSQVHLLEIEEGLFVFFHWLKWINGKFLHVYWTACTFSATGGSRYYSYLIASKPIYTSSIWEQWYIWLLFWPSDELHPSFTNVAQFWSTHYQEGKYLTLWML